MKPEEAHLKQAVYFDNREQRGLILGLDADVALVWRVPSEGTPVVVPIAGCEPFPLTHCFFCNKKHNVESAEVDQARALKRVKEDFGAVPPPERTVSLCKDCGIAIYEKDKHTTDCICAFSRGESKLCVCEWRRARPIGFPEEK